MTGEQLRRLIRATVDGDPVPPRPVPRWALLEHCLLNLPALAVMAVGALLLVGLGRLAAAGTLADLEVDRAGVGVLGVVAGGLVALPFVSYARLAASVRRGVRTTARVLVAEPMLRADAPACGAVGVRLVAHPHGAYEERFALDDEWATHLPVGAELDVLVHPEAPRVLHELGPEEGP